MKRLLTTQFKKQLDSDRVRLSVLSFYLNQMRATQGSSIKALNRGLKLESAQGRISIKNIPRAAD